MKISLASMIRSVYGKGRFSLSLVRASCEHQWIARITVWDN